MQKRFGLVLKVEAPEFQQLFPRMFYDKLSTDIFIQVSRSEKIEIFV